MHKRQISRWSILLRFAAAALWTVILCVSMHAGTLRPGMRVLQVLIILLLLETGIEKLIRYRQERTL